jgi:hydrogenase/urease accessory protein HupE
MKNNRGSSVLVAGLGMLFSPVAAAAHPGHGQGDHGWLMGAIQPFLGADHLLAAAFVLGVGALGAVAVGKHRAARAGRDSAE